MMNSRTDDDFVVDGTVFDALMALHKFSGFRLTQKEFTLAFKTLRPVVKSIYLSAKDKRDDAEIGSESAVQDGDSNHSRVDH